MIYSRLSLWSISCFRRTFPPHKHHIAHRTAKKWLTPLLGFGLTHAPDRTQGLDRKSTVSLKMSREGSHSLQRAVWRNGGCASLDNVTEQQVKWLVASAGSPPLRQAATTLPAMWESAQGDASGFLD
jgi:hypothetical protein